MKEIPFIKMDGLGNDFFIIEPENCNIKLSAKEIQKLGNRKTGIGFDQLFMLKPSKCADIKMVIYNSDGSQAGACGNGARCVADWVFNKTGAKECSIEAPGGKILKAFQGRLITVNMGHAKTDWTQIPLSKKTDTLYMPQFMPDLPEPCAVSMGNPHLVIFVPDISQVPLAAWGPQLETHPLFPRKTNVEFVQVLDSKTVRMRVWERGAGITQACGTGSCATAAACILNHKTEKNITVKLDGGDLFIEWPDKKNIFMTGLAQAVFTGDYWGN